MSYDARQEGNRGETTRIDGYVGSFSKNPLGLFFSLMATVDRGRS